MAVVQRSDYALKDWIYHVAAPTFIVGIIHTKSGFPVQCDKSCYHPQNLPNQLTEMQINV